MIDPTFNSVLGMELHDIKYQHGCAKCRHRGKKYWDKHLCKDKQKPNKMGFCWKWAIDE